MPGSKGSNGTNRRVRQSTGVRALPRHSGRFRISEGAPCAMPSMPVLRP